MCHDTDLCSNITISCHLSKKTVISGCLLAASTHFRIEGYLCEDTLLQGDGSDYDYCAAISEEERKRAVYSLMAHILPLGMFRLKDETTLVYQGGFEQWKREWVERIQTKAAKVNTENVMNFCGEVYQLET